MQIFGISLMAVGVFGLLLLAGHVAWQEVKTLKHLHRLDRWADEVPK